MLVFLPVHSSNPDFNADIECATIDVDTALIEIIEGRCEFLGAAYNEDSCAHQLSYYDQSVRFFDYGPIETAEEAGAAEIADAQAEGRPCVVPAEHVRFFDQSEPKQTEGDRMVLTVFPDYFEVHWECRPKHCDLTIATATVRVDWLASELQSYLEANTTTRKTEAES